MADVELPESLKARTPHCMFSCAVWMFKQALPLSVSDVS